MKAVRSLLPDSSTQEVLELGNSGNTTLTYQLKINGTSAWATLPYSLKTWNTIAAGDTAVIRLSGTGVQSLTVGSIQNVTFILTTNDPNALSTSVSVSTVNWLTATANIL